MGMMATVINGLALQSAFESKKAISRLFTAFRMEPVAEFYYKPKVIDALNDGEIVIFSGGTGNPFFTTDTAAALRASEMNCDALLKGTRVDGVYDADPEKDATATRFDTLSYLDVLSRDLKVMDASAISLARENKIPILVFSISESGGFDKVLRHQGAFTIVTEASQ